MSVAAGVIKTVNPDVVHIHHLTCLSVGLPKLLSDLRIPVVMTAHDYWMMCHRGQLFDLDGRRCAGPYDGGCDRCLPGVSGAGSRLVADRAGAAVATAAGSQPRGSSCSRAADAAMPSQSTRAASLERLACMREAAGHVDLFLAPSQTIADHLERLGVQQSRIRRRSQGVDLARFHRAAAQPSTDSPGLRIGFTGAFLPTKAPHLLLQAVQLLPRGSATVDLIGEGTAYHGDDSYREVLAPLLAAPFVRRVGPAPHERMPELFRDLDVLVVPSIWIENAPIVIHEAFALGVPVVASNLGGMAEAVTHDRTGLLFEAGSAGALAEQLRRLADEPGLLDRLRANIRPPRSLDEDVAELMQIYQQLSQPSRRSRPGCEWQLDLARSPERATPSSRTGVTAVLLNFNTADDTWLAVRSVQTSSEPPDAVIIVDNGCPIDRPIVCASCFRT